MSAPTRDLDGLYDVAVDEAQYRQCMVRFFGIDPQPERSGLLGSEPLAVPQSEAEEEAFYRQYMRQHFPGSVE
jgi:hypothetical protein